jgi:hypothetical protein
MPPLSRAAALNCPLCHSCMVTCKCYYNVRGMRMHDACMTCATLWIVDTTNAAPFRQAIRHVHGPLAVPDVVARKPRWVCGSVRLVDYADGEHLQT